MKRVLILVEGQTEETFIKEVLCPYFWDKQISLEPTIVTTKQVRSGPNFKGGVVNYDHVKRDLHKLLFDSDARVITTFIDLYALPDNFPGYSEAKGVGSTRVVVLERAWTATIDDRRFLPYFQVHEFEGLLFAAPDAFRWIYSDTVVEQIEAIAMSFATPEDINDSPDTAPSKRIIGIVGTEGGYDKILHGAILASEVGIERMRERCPHFNAWLNEVERRCS